MALAYSGITFTPAVRAMQRRMGSRDQYEAFDHASDPRDRLSEREAEFIEARDGFHQASVSETGWPYVQFRGGPAGFLKVLDERTIAYADFRGNVQYVSVGNLVGNDRVALILMDQALRRRLKVMGRVRFVDAKDDPALIERLRMPGYKAHIERAVLIAVDAFDWNCPQHITARFSGAEIDLMTAPLKQQLAQARAELAALRGRLPGGAEAAT